jgi:hypothetical protein
MVLKDKKLTTGETELRKRVNGFSIIAGSIVQELDDGFAGADNAMRE